MKKKICGVCVSAYCCMRVLVLVFRMPLCIVSPIYMCTCMRICICMHVCMCVYTYILNVDTYTQPYTYIYYIYIYCSTGIPHAIYMRLISPIYASHLHMYLSTYLQ